MKSNTEPIKFDIYVVTFNRPQLLKYTLQSLVNQTYKNFVVHLVDHGSSPAVDPKTFPNELDIRFTRYETNFIDQHGNDIAENVLSQLEGDYFMNFADDDILLPHALETAATLIQANPRIEIISGGFLTYNHDNNTPLHSLGFLTRYDETLSKFDGYQTALMCCSSWGIGPEVHYPIPPQSHSSTAFYSVRLIRETKKKQGIIYVKSCGDVGFLGLAFNTDYTYYLNTPLAVIGRSFNQYMNHLTPNNRFKWTDELQYLEHTPVRGESFQNIGVDSHLKVLHALGIDKQLDCSLRPDFFIRHISYILTDDPWTEKTYQDIEEAMPFFEKSIIKYHNCSKSEAKTAAQNWLNNTMAEADKQKKILKKKEQLDKAQRCGSYKNVLDYADKVMKFMTSSKTGYQRAPTVLVENPDQTMTIGVWGLYEESFKNNWVFHTPHIDLGDNLLKPMNDLYDIARQNRIELKSLDMVQNFETVDAFLFWDFPNVDSPLVVRAMTSNKPCYLVIAESPIVRPDNWIQRNHNHFTKIFTYGDDIIDDKRYFKLNYVTDMPAAIPRDLDTKKRLCTMIAGCKHVKHELSLYPHRIDAIRWFEKHHPEDFDLYGVGWNPADFPSYRGRIDSKLDVLRTYRFSICYENIRDINGYITEKIFDCLKAGCVPVYWGAKNVSDHIPRGCFIDKRDFRDYESLYVYLKEMSDDAYQKYLQNIAAFLGSEKAIPFTTEIFVKTLLEQVANRPVHLAPSTGNLAPLNTEAQTGKEHTMADNATKPASLPGSRDTDPLVTISMVHYNRLDCLIQCVDSIRKHTAGRYELIIIANGSPNASLDYLRSQPDIILIEIPTNVRPDLASLKSLAIARGDYIATISDDIILTPGWMDLFLGHMKRNPKVGLIGPRSNLVSGAQLVPNVPYKSIDELDAFAQNWTRTFKGHCSVSNRLVGFIFFYSRELLNKIGGTDPIFSFGYCDDDFTLRAIIAGFDAIIANDIFIHHTGGPQVRGDLVYHKKLKDSWEAFKTKWGLPPDLDNWNLNVNHLLSRKFDPVRHFVPLPDRSEVEKLIYKPTSAHATRQPQDASMDAPQVRKQEETPLVSAIVFTCNSERFIRGCLEDLEAQTIRNRMEIIVLDGVSDQNEAAIVKEFQKRYSNIKYIKTEERETVYGAWNRGIKAASGKYITNANTEDRHAPYAFERMAHVLDENPDISLVYADVWITEKENETFEHFSPARMFRGKEFDPDTLLEGCYIGPQPMWRKNVHEKHGYFDETFHSAGDWEFWLRMAQTEKFLHLKEFLGLDLKSPTGINNRDSKVLEEEIMRVRRKYAPRIVKSRKENQCRGNGRPGMEQAPSVDRGKDMDDEACQVEPRLHSYNSWQTSSAMHP